MNWSNATDPIFPSQLPKTTSPTWNSETASLRAEMNAGLAQLRLEQETSRASMMKWMFFIYWAGSTAFLWMLAYILISR